LVTAAAALYYFSSLYLGVDTPIPLYGFVLGGVSGGIILNGRYRTLELVAKISAGFLVLCTATVYLVKPVASPPWPTFSHLKLPKVPGSLS
jgi:hypothetical protein